jgi:tetratricopeptide (TPR) repeat protein
MTDFRGNLHGLLEGVRPLPGGKVYPTLGLSMLVRNASKTVERAVASIGRFCEEFVLVDGYSDDGTSGAAERSWRKIWKTKRFEAVSFTPVEHPDAFLLDSAETFENLLPGPFSNEIFLANFAEARQKGWSRLETTFGIHLDGDDECIESRTIPPILEIMAKDSLDCALLPYHYRHDDEGRPIAVHQRERIARISPSITWNGSVHEVLEGATNPASFEFPIIIDRNDGSDPRNRILHRNLKILLHRYLAGDRNERTLFLLGIEARNSDIEQLMPFALARLGDYIDKASGHVHRSHAQIARAEILEKMGIREEAIAEYRASLRTFELPEAHIGLGIMSYLDGKMEEAALSIEKSIECSGRPGIDLTMHSPRDRHGKARIFLSLAHAAMGDRDRALIRFEEGRKWFSETMTRAWRSQIEEKLRKAA